MLWKERVNLFLRRQATRTLQVLAQKKERVYPDQRANHPFLRYTKIVLKQGHVRIRKVSLPAPAERKPRMMRFESRHKMAAGAA
jgi:hypothetical protein